MADDFKIRHCATMEVFNRQAELFPAYRRAQAAIENEISYCPGKCGLWHLF